MLTLKRLSGGAGDSGVHSIAIGLNEKGDDIIVKGNRPIVGCLMQVGSVTARTYSYQDYWTTSLVLEIIEETENYVKFRTANSMYEWTS